MTVSELIKAAYEDCGVRDFGSDPDNAEYAVGLRTLNNLLSAWSAERIQIHGIFTENFPLIAGKASYTMGPGGDFDTAWAVSIVNAYLRDANDVDYPLQAVTRGEYDVVPSKNLLGRPYGLYYNAATYPAGTVTLLYVPDNAYTLFLDSQKVIKQFAAVSEELTLPPQFYEALEYNLAVRLSLKLNVPADPRMVDLARQSKAVLTQQPVEPVEFKGLFNYGVFDINIGGYR